MPGESETNSQGVSVFTDFCYIHVPIWLYSDSVAHESSYLPFLFSSEREDVANSTSKPRGRRTFNKHGLDISQDRLRSQLGRVNLLRLFNANLILICVPLGRRW